MKIQFIGSGDAFGSGGRFNTCFYVHTEHSDFLIDCGASSMISLKANRIALNDIQLLLITHVHADHFGGVPFFILDAQLISKRTRPLTIAGPKGLKEWYEKAMETGFPGSSKIKQKFDISIIELTDRHLFTLDGLRVTPFDVSHGFPEGSCFAYRIELDHRIIAYTGDTEWTDNLIEVGQGADLFIAEACFYDKNVRNHLDYATLVNHLDQINPKRLVLTHMGSDMLSRVSEIPHEAAEDGKIIEI